jgi:signal transduction histidine kinase
MPPTPVPTPASTPGQESSTRNTLLFLFGLAMLAIVAFIDWKTWTEIQLRLCYLIPTVFLAWYIGNWAALPVAVLGSGIWLAIEISYGKIYEHPAVPYINASVLLTASLIFTVMVSAVARRKRQLASEVQARIRAEQQLLTINETLEQRVIERTAAAESRARELQRSEEALSRSTAILTAILGTMTEAVAVTDSTGVLKLVNPAAMALLGISAKVGGGMLLPADSSLTLIPLLDGYRNVGPTVQAALRGIDVAGADLGHRQSPDKSGPWLTLSAHRVPLGRTSEEGVAFILTDVSASKETERLVSDAIEEEQQRIGQDLHDGLGQHLVCTAMAVSALRDRLIRQDALGPDSVREISTLVDESITHVRDIARGLFPASLEHQGLATTLRGLADQVTRSTRIRCEVEAAAVIIEPVTSIAFHLYRIAQEAVANAIRHNAPSQIIIRLEEPANQLRLSVISVGKPVAPVTTGRTGLGLAIMQHRARLIQGDLQIYAEPQGDTVVECTISYPEIKAR